MRAQDVAVRDHHVGRDPLAAGQHDAGHAAAGVLDPLDRLAAAHVERAGERLDHAVHPAVDVPAAVEHLQVDERAVDRRHPVRIAADEQRVEGERLAHPRVLEVARDDRSDSGRSASSRDHVRDEPEEVRAARRSRAARRRGSPARRSAGASSRNGSTCAASRGGEPRHLGAQRVAVRAEVEVPLLAGPVDPVERLEPPQRQLGGAGRARRRRTSPRAPTASSAATARCPR